MQLPLEVSILVIHKTFQSCDSDSFLNPSHLYSEFPMLVKGNSILLVTYIKPHGVIFWPLSFTTLLQILLMLTTQYIESDHFLSQSLLPLLSNSIVSYLNVFPFCPVVLQSTVNTTVKLILLKYKPNSLSLLFKNCTVSSYFSHSKSQSP